MDVDPEIAGEDEESYTKPFPEKSRAAFLKIADALIEDGLDTPQQVADALAARFGEKVKPYSAALWDTLRLADPENEAYDLLGKNIDWAALYALEELPEDDAPAPPPLSKTTESDGGVDMPATNDPVPVLPAPPPPSLPTAAFSRSRLLGSVPRKGRGRGFRRGAGVGLGHALTFRGTSRAPSPNVSTR